MLGVFGLAINAHDPPARAVVEQLNAVNAAHKRLPIIGVRIVLDCQTVNDPASMSCSLVSLGRLARPMDSGSQLARRRGL
jgi:hypothetical protein